jgi:hypothetical protein
MWSVRDSLDGESTFISHTLGFDSEELGTENVNTNWNARLEKATMNIGSMAGALQPSQDELHKLTAGLLLIVASDSSRHQLVRSGMSRSVVEVMPSSQALLLSFRLNFDSLLSDLLKYSLLPQNVMEDHIDRFEAQFKKRVGEGFADPVTITLGLVFPAYRAALSATRRTHAERNRLATLEAIRAFAANGGKLPQSLAELTTLPALTNPFTQKHFEYRRISDREAIFHKSQYYSGDKKTEMKLLLQTSK